MKPKIISLNVGKPAYIAYNGKTVSTGINKTSTAERLFLSATNFDGDGQADLKHHGGPDKAVCVYCIEHYPYWERELQREMGLGAFGENLTVTGLTEPTVHIGDTFLLGEAVVQISQPRQPCFKLAVKYGVPDMPVKVQNTGYTGYYFRVLEEGYVSKESRLTRLAADGGGISVEFANRIMHHDKENMDGVRRILAVTALSASWRATFEKRLVGMETDTKARLIGE
ncbi:MOSC domain-containing protein [Paenibacillus contaminans]|uniref:MOSC domain-containing protein n=1 Tax=Paenibacillus contaminans TaxID=450362 RepID=A0A329MM16_9BACL|nr:MOSC domain-containing protein [Paenibacillus contaminans]